MSILSNLQRAVVSIASQLDRRRLYHYFALCSSSGKLPVVARKSFGLEK